MLRESLDRTLLLMRDELVADVDDADLIAALTSTHVVLISDAENLSSHGAHCAFITAALLMARSGHRVCLAAPDVLLVGAQPPLRGSRLITSLLEIGTEVLFGGVGFSTNVPPSEAALFVLFGSTTSQFRARRVIAVNATAWSGSIGTAKHARPCIESLWPCGALAAGAMASVEAFKASMHLLRHLAKDASRFDDLFRFSDQITVKLAPDNTPQIARLGRVDFISGGAITNSTLYLLARLPGVIGSGRIIDSETIDHSNLNRYALMLRSAFNRLKVSTLKSLMPQGLVLEALPLRFEGGRTTDVGALAPHVLVGVDDIPTRWAVQAEQPQWLGIGATTHWDSMASFHQTGLACARCLHPRDDSATTLIPTVGFVSFFAGLVLGSYFLRVLGGDRMETAEQCTYFSPLRPEIIWRTPVMRRESCPTCSPGSGLQAA